jgi:UDP-2-acetamido-3-amino-2,3-dideoxy-glucuronate N-acetyltransferase
MTSKNIKGVNIHESAEVQSSEIGTGTTIWQFCVILAKAKIGTNCNINCHVFIEHDVVIGNNVTVKSGVQIWDGVTLGDDVFIGPNVTFTNDLVPRSKVYPEKYLLTHIEDRASIGANATIIGGISIGKYAVIGAGSVVTKDIPGSFALVWKSRKTPWLRHKGRGDIGFKLYIQKIRNQIFVR